MRKKDIWDVLFWILMLILILYIVAKLIGWIKTPEWFELIPLITIVFLIGVFYQKVVNFIEIAYKRTDYLKKSLDRIDERVSKLEEKR